MIHHLAESELVHYVCVVEVVEQAGSYPGLRE